MRKVKTAVISAAGFSTRFLPTTKTVPKELIPILETPTIEYIIEELYDAGIEKIIFVTKRGNTATEDYFDKIEELENALEKSNKVEYLDKVRRMSKLIKNIAFIRQDKDLPYGNATPLINAKPFIGNEPFIYVFCDDLIIGDISTSKELIDRYESSDTDGVIIVQEKPREELHRYGVANLKENNLVDSIIEKPIPGDTNSNLVSYGRYVFSPKFLEYLDVSNVGKNNELWIVDAINRYAKENRVEVLKASGTWYTTGDPLNLFKLTLEIASKRDEYREYMKEFINKI